MKRYLLDTNVVSELRKPKPHGAVLAWIANLSHEQVFVSAFTVGELQAGVELTRIQDPNKAREIDLWLDKLGEAFEVLAMDQKCFREWARIMHRQREHLLGDAMIAATARVHGLIVATRNERDFERLGAPLINPFAGR